MLLTSSTHKRLHSLYPRWVFETEATQENAPSSDGTELSSLVSYRVRHRTHTAKRPENVADADSQASGELAGNGFTFKHEALYRCVLLHYLFFLEANGDCSRRNVLSKGLCFAASPLRFAEVRPIDIHMGPRTGRHKSMSSHQGE